MKSLRLSQPQPTPASRAITNHCLAPPPNLTPESNRLPSDTPRTESEGRQHHHPHEQGGVCATARAGSRGRTPSQRICVPAPWSRIPAGDGQGRAGPVALRDIPDKAATPRRPALLLGRLTRRLAAFFTRHNTSALPASDRRPGFPGCEKNSSSPEIHTPESVQASREPYEQGRCIYNDSCASLKQSSPIMLAANLTRFSGGRIQVTAVRGFRLPWSLGNLSPLSPLGSGKSTLFYCWRADAATQGSAW